MVRRGSTVRVRQRALQKRRSRRFFLRVGLQVVQVAPGMEPFMEPSDEERFSEAAKLRRNDGSGVTSVSEGAPSNGVVRVRLGRTTRTLFEPVKLVTSSPPSPITQRGYEHSLEPPGMGRRRHAASGDNASGLVSLAAEPRVAREQAADVAGGTVTTNP